ncbi:hypothetical protein LK07_27955 [Streptomyces pluripotens]|uniref:Uncharacterized protein n=1 Tax=Streptomyces pluripotens TaxID=1355015 RepID=A0A221P4P8_9ACTN|nr:MULTISPECIES: hypothetical protein [Streptomyces]ARP72978.1 hypothetical protein LK06_026795 [Streptomyces pluripotens]ASN27229.1 hypothetical protein LK07_27955 [Streptomyces pluripotens]KIE28773.1 hypothetical protein LK08_01880 [Streptomyces sp. MUSC 125]MCH0557889.1 hypothetical protein [Streptomyces sp. MUM 16J]
MSTYNFGSTGATTGFGGPTEINHYALDLATLMNVADRLTETLHTEYPGLVHHGEVIEAELAQSAEDGLPPNRGRIRSALEAISIGAAAGTGSLTFTQHLMQALGL